jgi:hypothetical protein
MVQPDQIEITGGLSEGTRVITTGAAALRENDRIVVLGGDGGEPGTGPALGQGAASGGRGERARGRNGAPPAGTARSQ